MVSRMFGEKTHVKNESGVSEVIGSVLLISVVVIGVAIVGVVLMSHSTPEKIPALSAVISEDTTQRIISIYNDGGDALSNQTMTIRLDGVDKTTHFTKSGSPWQIWTIGESLKYTVPATDQMPGIVQIVYSTGSSATILASADFSIGLPTTGTTSTSTTSPTAPVTSTTSPVPGTSHNITASAGTGGSISPNGKVNVTYGAGQTFSITANSGYNIAAVSIDGNSIGPQSAYTFPNVVADHTITATFTINTYTITASTGASGNVTPAGVTTVNYGATPLYTITPNTGYHVVDVLVNGASVGAVTSYSFPGVTANQTISATFAITYTTGFIANYYSDETWTNLAGTRIDNEIRYANAEANTTYWLHAPTDESNWPVPMVGRDTSFSVTWDGYLLVTTGDTYTFSLTSDDGSKLWIDDGLVIDNSGSNPQVPTTGAITLTPGYYHIVVKMFQHYSQAIARLQYSSSTMSLQQVTNVWHTSTSS